MYRFAVLCLIAAWWPCRASLPAQAQASGHRIGIEAGALRSLNRDEQASPVLYRTTAWPVALAWRYSGARVWHTTRIEGSRARLTSDITSGDLHVQRGIRLRAATLWTHRLGALRGVRLLAGPSLGAEVNFRSHRYSSSPTERVGYALAAPGLALAAGIRPAPATEAMLTVQVPLGALTIRPAWSVKGRLEPRVQGPWDALHSTFALDAAHRLSPRMGVRLRAAATYTRLATPRTMRALDAGLSLGYDLCF